MNQELDTETSAIEAQLEGIFRQLYQSCTQQSLKFKVAKYRYMLGQANELFDKLEHLIQTYIIENADA